MTTGTPEVTQGEWQWDAGIIPPDGPGRYADIFVLDEDGEPIIIAEFNDSLPEGRANAQIMTSAKALLRSLEALAGAAAMTPNFSSPLMLKGAFETIAKAKGETQ